MSITVNIYYSGQNGSARKFAEEMINSGTVSAIRNEPGNLKYEYFYPVDDEETVLLIDNWESQEAIDAHHATDMMKKIFELREKYDLHMKVERFVSAEQGFTFPNWNLDFHLSLGVVTSKYLATSTERTMPCFCWRTRM